MNTPLPALPLSVQVPGSYKKKRVLLVDASPHKRDLRAEVMRKLGIDVDCAADIDEARSWWRADLYDLVLIDLEKGLGQRDRFCEDVRGAKPPQRLAFLVGGPEYLADAPMEIGPLPDESTKNADIYAVMSEVKDALSDDPVRRWGILEASRRISAVRSACTARAQAIRDRPPNRRNSEGRPSKRVPESKTLDNLVGEME